MDIEIGKEGEEGHEKGKVVMELFEKDVPKTAENFRCLKWKKVFTSKETCSIELLKDS